MNRNVLRFAAAALAVAASPAWSATKVLVLADDVNLAPVLADITGSDARIDHTGSSTYSLTENLGTLPSAAYLSGFDSVLLFTNYESADYTALSNLLGAYVNHGGGVVISTFWGQEAGTAGGLLNSHGYNPLTNPTFDAYSSNTLGIFDPADPLFAGVTSLSSSTYNADYLTGLDGGATLAGSWASGRPLAAYSASHKVAAITLFPNVAGYSHATGDYAQLFSNALVFTAGAVPEPASWGLMIVGFGMIGATMRRRATTVRSQSSLA